MAKNDFACKDYIPTFKKTETYSKLSQSKIFKDSANPYLSDKEDITLKRWLQNTEKSILNMSVGSFK